MKVYIAGPITGVSDYQARFEHAALVLQAKGYDVVNPALDGTGEAPWTWYMRRALKLLLDCDAVYFLRNWRDSRGANLEHFIAAELGMVLFYEESGEKP